MEIFTRNILSPSITQLEKILLVQYFFMRCSSKSSTILHLLISLEVISHILLESGCIHLISTELTKINKILEAV